MYELAVWIKCSTWITLHPTTVGKFTASVQATAEQQIYL